KDGRSNAKLKLIAGILGVGYDALKQRELRRAQRKLFAIASGAVAGMVITSGLAVAALFARVTAQRETVIAKREAETARQTTAFLVDLFRISDPSEARGNSLTAREVLDRGAARIQTQLTHQPQIQATLMDTLGTVYMGLGLYKPAQPLLQAAMTIRQSLPQQERSDLALSLTHLGDLKTARAEYPGAESAYDGALTVQRSLPPNERDEATYAKTLFGLGSEQIERGRNADAAAACPGRRGAELRRSDRAAREGGGHAPRPLGHSTLPRLCRIAQRSRPDALLRQGRLRSCGAAAARVDGDEAQAARGQAP